MAAIAAGTRAAATNNESRTQVKATRFAAAHDGSTTRDMGDPWNSESFASTWQSFIKKTDYQVRFHDLRHTCATLLLQAGVHPKVVSEMLGHSTVTITLDTYSHVLPSMQQDAVARLEAALSVNAGGAS